MSSDEQFRDAIRASGLEPPDVIEADGKLHRFSSNGKRGDDAGWYILHGDGIPAGGFGDWRTGIKGAWRDDMGRALTPAEEAAHRVKVEAMRREREAEDTRRHREVATAAAAIWKAALPATDDHPYLSRKCVTVHGVRIHDGALVVPLRDGAALHSLQFINADGQKQFLTGGRVVGCYFSIGNPKDAAALCIAEGFATGATIFEATGYPVAVAFNAGNLEAVARALRAKFPDVTLILCADDDAVTAGNPGLTKATAAALAVGGKLAVPDFGADRPEGVSDFNDMAVHCGAEAVVRAIAEARTPASKSENQATAGTVKTRTPITVRISDVQRENVSWLWQDRVPIGKLTLIEGNPGLGKSWLTLAIATAVSTGSALPGDVAREAANSILMSAEDGLADTIRPRLEDMGAVLDRVIALRGMMSEAGREQSITLADLDVLETVIIAEKPRLVIVDPIIAFTGGKDTHKANEVRSLLAPLAALAEKHSCAIVAVRHLNKSTAQALYRGQGSIDFVAACRSAFVVGENPDDAEERVLCHLKSNLAPKTSSLAFGIDQGRFGWKGESSLTAEQVLAVPAEGEEKTRQGDAKSFLEELLADGPVNSAEVEKQAKAAGIARATLWRAKGALEVSAKKTGFNGGWQWHIPDRRYSSSPEDTHTKTVSTLGKNEDLRDKESGWEDVS